MFAVSAYKASGYRLSASAGHAGVRACRPSALMAAVKSEFEASLSYVIRPCFRNLKRAKKELSRPCWLTLVLQAQGTLRQEDIAVNLRTEWATQKVKDRGRLKRENLS